MNLVALSSAGVILLFSTSICLADSLVITYRSGKTQTVVLDEPSQGVSSWQFVGGAAPQQSKQIDETLSPLKFEHIKKDPSPQTKDDNKLTEKAPEKKSGVRVKWNAKPIPD